MTTQTQANKNEVGTIEQEASALLTATAGVGGEKLDQVRKRLAVALEHGKEICGRVRQKAVEGAKTTDESIHKHPYQAIGIALGVGALLGYVVALGRSRNHE